MALDQENKSLFNVPNILSAYRLCAAPILILCILRNVEDIFIALISLNFLTDIIDGYVARRWNLQTEFGARLDSYADISTYFLAIGGMFAWKDVFVRTHYVAFTSLIISYLLPQLLSIVRFGRPTSMHLYSSKVCGYVQGAFLLSLFWFGESELFLYFMCAIAITNNIEELLVLLRLKTPLSNAQSIFHILKRTDL